MKSLFVLLTLIFLTACGPVQDKQSYNKAHQITYTSSPTAPSTESRSSKENEPYKIPENTGEFQLTPSEKIELNERGWATRKHDLYTDAFTGNRAAIYLLGKANQSGELGLPINSQYAHILFQMSASLGFGPAIRELIIAPENENNMWLSMIYINLLISQGHHESKPLYIKYKSSLLSLGAKGQRIVAEIERVANSKFKKILKNQIKLKATKTDTEKHDFYIELSLNSTYALDSVMYSYNYWIDLFEGKVEPYTDDPLKEDENK